MSRFLFCSNPLWGHLSPMITVGRYLVSRGDEVTVLTGRKYQANVERAGLRFRALPASVDYDDQDLDAWLPGRAEHKGLAAVRYDLIGMFARVIPDQHRAVQAALVADRYDAVVGEGAFMGLLPTMLMAPASSRIPVLGVSAIPLTLTSVDCAPFGPALAPGRSVFSRLRNRILNTLVHAGPLKPIQTALVAALAEVGCPPPRGTFFDQPTTFDRLFQLSAPSLEYPRRELPDTVSFLGPLPPAVPADSTLPTWWDDLDGRLVVHVTQGTIDNTHLERLVVPTLRALADRDVLVVAATGGRPVEEVTSLYGGPLPENARVAEFLPYGDLLPRTSVVVTNGGFGGVQQALAHGIPLVVAGDTEDKPEVAARVQWSGSGVNLRSGAPSPAAIAAGVDSALTDPAYGRQAKRIAAELAALGDPRPAIARALDEVVRTRAGASSRP